MGRTGLTPPPPSLTVAQMEDHAPLPEGWGGCQGRARVPPTLLDSSPNTPV